MFEKNPQRRMHTLYNLSANTGSRNQNQLPFGTRLNQHEIKFVVHIRM